MDQTETETTRYSWKPFTLDHLLNQHGLTQYKSIALLMLWSALIAISMISAFFMISGSWVDGYLDQASIHSYFMFYPPLIIGTLLLFWLGFDWGFIPLFLATFVIAFASNMPFYWAILFALSFVLGLGIYALAYYSVQLETSLRSIKSFAFFVVVSFIAAIASSLGSFIWSLAHDMSVANSMVLWQGWWTGVLLQSVLIIAPLLLFFTPQIEKIKKQWFELPEQHHVTLKWLYGSIFSVSVVLGLFVIGTSSLGTQIMYDLSSALNLSATNQFLQATDSFQIITGISITLVLGMGLGGIYLVGSWNKHLQEEVDVKTAALQKSREELKESLREKEDLLEGIHDRMRSNLSIIMGMLEVQLKNAGDRNLDTVLQDSHSRLQSLSLVHETLFDTRSVDSLNIKLYVIKLINRLDHSKKYEGKEIKSIVRANDFFLSLDRAIPLAMVLNELISNIYQHAFEKGEKGTMRLRLKVENDNAIFELSDTGIGLPENLKQLEKNHFGLKLSKLLISQLEGRITIADPESSKIKITLPISRQEADRYRQSDETNKEESEPVASNGIAKT